MTDTPPEKPRRSWIKAILFVSLALNLLVVGAIVGRFLSPDGPRSRDRVEGPVRSVIGEPFVRALSWDDRRALLEDLKSETPRIRETRENLRQRFEAFLVALRADPFVPEDIGRLLEDQRQVAKGRQELGEMLLLRRLEAMSAEERAAYADRLERSLRRLRRR
ncbi:MAG: periplasmic heavy metal sensor [Silicimonas sp.]|nr:periplasmic heavy metal sensor [Silicimonas sp.]